MNIDYDAFSKIIIEFEKDFMEKEKAYFDEDLGFSMEKINHVYTTKNGLEITITLNRGNDDD